VLDPSVPFDLALFPYSTQIDPAPVVIESGLLAAAPPEANTVVTAVGVALAAVLTALSATVAASMVRTKTWLLPPRIGARP